MKIKQTKVLLKEKISIDNFEDKKFKIRLKVSKKDTEAAFRHYLHNHKNEVSQFYKPDAIEYVKNLFEYKFPEEKISNIVAEEALQYLIFQQENIPFSVPQKPEFKFIDLFAGIGGFRLAFQNLQGKCIFTSEWDKYSKQTYQANFGEVPFGDITKKSTKDYIPDRFDVLCAGFPCQAFSLAGWKNGLADERGQLTLTFIEIANAIDKIRLEDGKDKSIVLWENVEGVLNDKTNAFGNFIAGLAGFDEEIKVSKWTKSGYLEGKDRNLAWRVIDAKYFGLPHQRKRLYVLAGGKNFKPDQVLFEFNNKDIVKELELKTKNDSSNIPSLFSSNILEKDTEMVFHKQRVKFEMFREYTDCLYAAYGTKWNGNAATHNGSLYVSENDRIRRFTPLECERLMGFPDNYTKVNGNSHTNRFQAVGNSWAVPVVKWIGSQIKAFIDKKAENRFTEWKKAIQSKKNKLNALLYLLDGTNQISQSEFLNSSNIPNNQIFGDLKDIVEPNHAIDKFFLSAKACAGILRRKNERKINMNSELESLLTRISKREKIQTEKKRQYVTLCISNSGLSDKKRGHWS